jgi:hypothetical protein
MNLRHVIAFTSQPGQLADVGLVQNIGNLCAQRPIADHQQP